MFDIIFSLSLRGEFNSWLVSDKLNVMPDFAKTYGENVISKTIDGVLKTRNTSNGEPNTMSRWLYKDENKNVGSIETVIGKFNDFLEKNRKYLLTFSNREKKMNAQVTYPWEHNISISIWVDRHGSSVTDGILL
ncbi:MAG: hypothetical protein LIP77_07245, partial [Planctomycetes bacterium]|nr:hypothetical protein [Planctomycetota bacterium]